MAGKRTKDITGTQTSFNPDLVLLIDKIDTGSGDWLYAQKVPMKYLGNTYIQGSSNGINWHNAILSSDTMFQISSDGGVVWVTLDTSVIPEDTNLYFTEARVLATPGVQGAVDDSHTHSNLAVLNNVIDTGGGTSFLADDGTYKNPTALGSPLTTKGDLWAYSTADTRLGVGTDGYILSADSTETTGLKWIAYTGGAHASTHIDGGSDEIDGDKLNITWTPSNYTPATTPTEVDAIDQLTAHLYGIDQVLGTSSGGDMTAAVYDPTSVQSDAFNMDNMAEGVTNLILTSAERTILSNTSGINTGDQASSDFTHNALTGLNDGTTYLHITSVQQTNFTTAYTHSQVTSGNPHSVTLAEVGVSDLDDISDGTTYVRITATNYTDLTDAGDSALHYHSTDRDRSNHTGTQTASTISDFDTEVTNNSTVAANTAARHGAMTLAGTYDYLTLSLQEITMHQIDLSTDVTGLLPVASVTGLAAVATSGAASDLTGLATVATTGAYSDLSGTPTSSTWDHNALTNTHNLTTDIDHGLITGLGDDDHTIYSLVSGTRAYTGIVSYSTHPTFSSDTSIVDKKYVDDAITAGGGYTDEDAQDAVGAMVSNEFTYIDATPLLQLNYANISHTDLQDIGTNSHATIDTHLSNNTVDVTLAGSYDYITISGQQITRNQIDLSTDVTGSLPAGSVSGLATVATSGDYNDLSNLTWVEGATYSLYYGDMPVVIGKTSDWNSPYGLTVFNPFDDHGVAITAGSATDPSLDILLVATHATAGDVLNVWGDGDIQLDKYGLGNFTGTAAYTLAVDSSGHILEVDLATDVYIPYTGATQSVDLGTHGLTANDITIDKTSQPTLTLTDSTTSWDIVLDTGVYSIAPTADGTFKLIDSSSNDRLVIDTLTGATDLTTEFSTASATYNASLAVTTAEDTGNTGGVVEGIVGTVTLDNTTAQLLGAAAGDFTVTYNTGSGVDSGYATRSRIYANSGAANLMAGHYIVAEANSSSNIDWVLGITNYVNLKNSNTIQYARGMNTEFDISGTNTITGAASLYNGHLYVSGGADVPLTEGIYVKTSVSDGNIDKAVGGTFDVSTSGTGTIVDGYGIIIGEWENTAMTNSYGLYLDSTIDAGSTLAYAIYSAATSDSLFTGNIQMQDTPTADNHLARLVDITGRFPTSSTDNAIVRFNGTTGILQDSVVEIDDEGRIYPTGLNDSIAIGYAALYSDDGTNENIGIGATTLYNQVAGTGNIAIGYWAGRFYDSSLPLTSSQNSIYIGSNTKALANTSVDEIVIGANMIGHGSNTTSIGNDSNTKTYLVGTLEHDAPTLDTESALLSDITGGTSDADFNTLTLNSSTVNSISTDGTFASNSDLILPTQKAIKTYVDATSSSKPIQVTSLTLTYTSWSLVGSYYEYDLSNANITANSIVDVIPDNDDVSIVIAAEMLPRTDSSSGSVKLYAVNAPTADIGVTINITDKA